MFEGHIFTTIYYENFLVSCFLFSYIQSSLLVSIRADFIHIFVRETFSLNCDFFFGKFCFFWVHVQSNVFAFDFWFWGNSFYSQSNFLWNDSVILREQGTRFGIHKINSLKRFEVTQICVFLFLFDFFFLIQLIYFPLLFCITLQLFLNFILKMGFLSNSVLRINRIQRIWFISMWLIW